MSKLRISLFGDFRASCDNWESELYLTPMGQSLLSYLLLYRHRYHQRALLIGLFWGDQEEDKARNCLNSTLWRLRSVLEPGDPPRGTYLVSAPSDKVGFNRDSNFWLDVADFEANCTAGLAQPLNKMANEDLLKLTQATKLYKGDLLDGYYDDWALRKREQLRNLYLRCLRRLMQYHELHQDYRKSIEYGQRILQLDPLKEDIHRAMMNLYVANGQRALAIKQYETCCRILAAELDIPPLEETQALYARIVPPGPAISFPVVKDLDRQPAFMQLGQAINNIENACKQLQQAFQLLTQQNESNRDYHQKR